MNEPEEIFDVVDMDDRVLRQATRKEVHEKSLIHRSVHILVFDPEGRLFLQKRAMTKDENPGLWDTSAAGHVTAGDDYPSTAARELEEELGILEPLTHIMKIKAGPDTYWEHVALYSCSTRKPITINPQEISQGRYFSLEEIRNGFATDPGRYTSSFKLIFQKVLGK